MAGSALETLIYADLEAELTFKLARGGSGAEEAARGREARAPARARHGERRDGGRREGVEVKKQLGSDSFV